MNDALLNRVIARHITLLRYTIDLYHNIVQTTSQADATTYRDGGTGWTVLEVLGHVREFNTVFHERAQRFIHEDHPTLVPYDHEQTVIERRYNEQDLHAVFEAFAVERVALIDFFKARNPEDWARTATHPEWEVGVPMTLLDQLMQIGHHDVNHLEQITRILAEQKVS
jgi:hypothetical protein